MTNNTIKFLTNERDEGNRLDIILSNKIKNLTRSNLKKIIESQIELISLFFKTGVLMTYWDIEL